MKKFEKFFFAGIVPHVEGLDIGHGDGSSGGDEIFQSVFKEFVGFWFDHFEHGRGNLGDGFIAEFFHVGVSFVVDHVSVGVEIGPLSLIDLIELFF